MPSFQSKPDSHEVAVGFARLFLVFSLWILALQKDFLFLGNPTSLRQRLLLVFDSGFRMTRTYDTTTLQLLSCSEWSAVIESCFLLKKTHLLQTPDRAAGLKTASVVMLESTLTSVSRYTFLWYFKFSHKVCFIFVCILFFEKQKSKSGFAFFLL